jgi:DNA polymerase-3 subunit delta'
MPLCDVLYQDAAQERLQLAVRSGRVPHAYLFAGLEGVGKEMLARRFAAMLLCGERVEAPASTAPPDATTGTRLDACGQCDDCRLIAAGTHPDLHPIYRTLNRLHPEKKVQNKKAVDLSVDVVRHFLIAPAWRHPSRGRAKVFVVIEAHRLSNGAQNALLKVLEEPPGQSYLILLTTSADALLTTIRSRCHEVSFQRLATPFIEELLAGRDDVSPRAARFLAELSQGSAGAAILYAEIGLPDRLKTVLGVLRQAVSAPLHGAKALLDLSKELTPAFKEQDEAGGATNATRQAQTTILAVVSTLLRDIQRVAVGRTAAALPDDRLIASLGASVALASVGRAIRAVATAEYEINHNANASLVFDSVCIELGRGLAPATAAARAGASG